MCVVQSAAGRGRGKRAAPEETREGVTDGRCSRQSAGVTGSTQGGDVQVSDLQCLEVGMVMIADF